jgi:acyl-CoA thioesterase
MPHESPAHDLDALSRAQAAVKFMFSADAASQALGIDILDISPGSVQIAMTVRPEMLNGHGLCHGGVLFAFADSAFAFACNSYGDAMVAAGASIEFLAPTPRGERLTATATEVVRGPRHGIYDVAVTAADGTMLAQFRGRCSPLRKPKP